MKIGTRTLLFGVHQFLWHPFTVWRAWRWLYGYAPSWWQCIAIFCHDLGYVGKPNLDGTEGKTHPDGGAELTRRIVFKLARLFQPRRHSSTAAYWYRHDLAECAYLFSRHHSREYAKQLGETPSQLCWADKACILFDPPWLYLLRARLSGELAEFKTNAEPYIGKVSDEAWLQWYRARVRNLLLNPCVGADARAVEEIKTGRR